jgi:DNA polymerase-3 subunit alpha
LTDFVHLHVHSEFSLLDGAAPVEALAAKARSLGMRHIAITDHGNMFGVLEFAAACWGDADDPDPMPEAERIHPIIGCEAYMAPASRLEKAGAENDNKYHHLVLLAYSAEGYHNLLKLSSLAYTEGFYYKPRIDEEILVKYHAGLIGLSACIAGEIPSLILRGRTDDAQARALRLREIFGPENFYLELQDHGLEQQKQSNRALIELSQRTGIPLVATNDIHFIEKEDWAAQDILLCVSTNKKRSDEKRLRYTGNEYFKTGDEMAALFPDCPEAIANTVKIAERCVTELPWVTVKELPNYLPDFAIPPEFSGADEYLRHLTMEGLPRRYSEITQRVKEQAEYELGVIIKMNFTGYFLIVADFINWAKDHGISVGPGRGSGAGSIVAYALRITDIDPLKYGLLFERFLNPERISFPDFDVDFCNERREEVIAYVTEKYGKDRVGQIITFGTLGAKAVIKDVARALDISLDESDMITKLIPFEPKITLKKAMEGEPRLAALTEDPKYKELFELAFKLEGKKRNASLHAAGVVIGRAELSDQVPLYRDKSGGVATQFTMGLLESQGLVKMDFLGLKTLDLIKNTEDIIRQRGGEYADFSVENAGEDDKATFDMLGRGENEGVFQFEKDWWKGYLKDAKPSSIGELTALTSLGRPGPMEFLPQYIDCKWGKRSIRYPDPCLEDILKETYGVTVYQEQVMQIARRIAGYSMSQADNLRKAMGKKKPEIIAKERKPFIEGAVNNGFTAEHAGEIYDILAPFAGYGFNKSHAAAYAVLAFRTAYLRAHFPAEFMAANLSNEIGNPDKLPWFIDVARNMGIEIDPPDINRSDKLFTVVDGRIVYGFLGIKGIGDGPAGEILLRRKEGPYKSFTDFLERVTLHTSQAGQHIVSRKVLELLIKTGAFDKFGRNRATLLANMEAAVDYTQKKKDDTKFGQASLFGGTEEKTFPDFVFTEVPEMDRADQLGIELELIGFYFSGHPLDDYREAWRQKVTVNLGAPESIQPGEYTLVGIIKSLRPITDKSGKSMAFGSLEDYNGEIDLVFFNRTWEDCRDSIQLNGKAALKGTVDTNRGKLSFKVSSLLDINKLQAAAKRAAAKNPGAPAGAAASVTANGAAVSPGVTANAADNGKRSFRELHIRLRRTAAGNEKNLYPLRDYLIGNPGPAQVYIHVPPAGTAAPPDIFPETVIRTAAQLNAAADSEHLAALKHCEAVAEVWGA